MTRRILVVEDDPVTSEFIAKGLLEQGFIVDCVADGRDGLFHATDGSYQAIILDRMLPGLTGIQLLHAVRAAGIETPVIFLSALATVDDRVAGLRAGSNDYLVKPFAFAELLARVELMTRSRPSAGQVETELVHDNLVLNLLKRRVTRGDRQIELLPREFLLLEFLLRHAGRVVTRTMLLEGVWDYHFDPATNVIDVHMSRLRRKIDGEGETSLIHTVRGAGYRLGD